MTARVFNFPQLIGIRLTTHKRTVRALFSLHFMAFVRFCKKKKKEHTFPRSCMKNG